MESEYQKGTKKRKFWPTCPIARYSRSDRGDWCRILSSARFGEAITRAEWTITKSAAVGRFGDQPVLPATINFAMTILSTSLYR